jgi:hypothetical protein
MAVHDVQMERFDASVFQPRHLFGQASKVAQ